MRRREFIRLLGGAAAASTLGARGGGAQQGMPRIAVLVNASLDDPETRARLAAFQQGLAELGWTEGRNVRIDYRNGLGNAERGRAAARELLGLQPDVIVAQGALVMDILFQETRSVPIVFTNVSDPVGAGFVASLAHPGGNVTGFSQWEYTMGGKWLELLKQIAPGVTRVAAIFNPENPATPNHLRTIRAASESLALQVTEAPAHDNAELERMVAAFASGPNGGLMALPGFGSSVDRALVVALAARHRLPAIYPTRTDASLGGLISYGIDTVHPSRQAASYVVRILQGEKPADMPVQQPTKFEMIINLKTAKALGIDVSPTLSARADEVIE